MCQNRQVIVTSLACCWYSGGAPQSPDFWSSCNAREKMGEWGMEGDSDIVIEDVCGCDMQNLGGRLVFMLMRTGILVGKVVVVAVEAMSFSEKWSFSVMEVKCLRVGFRLVGGDILDLSEGFLAVVVEIEVDDLE